MNLKDDVNKVGWLHDLDEQDIYNKDYSWNIVILNFEFLLVLNDDDVGVCTSWWPYMDVTMTIFLVFLRYKKINEIKSIEIFFKKIHISKAIIINLPKMKKSNENNG